MQAHRLIGVLGFHSQVDCSYEVVGVLTDDVRVDSYLVSLVAISHVVVHAGQRHGLVRVPVRGRERQCRRRRRPGVAGLRDLAFAIVCGRDPHRQIRSRLGLWLHPKLRRVVAAGLLYCEEDCRRLPRATATTSCRRRIAVGVGNGQSSVLVFHDPQGHGRRIDNTSAAGHLARYRHQFVVSPHIRICHRIHVIIHRVDLRGAGTDLRIRRDGDRCIRQRVVVRRGVRSRRCRQRDRGWRGSGR